jgi:plasmid stabilization system protein ParE
MSQLLRYFVALTAAICLFLAAFGALLLYQQHQTDSLARVNNEFFSPSRLHLTRALVALDDATLVLSKKSWALPGEAHVPVNFGVQANLVGVEQNLLELIRLRYDYDYLEVFGLPSAALQRLQTIREQFDARLADPSTSGTSLDSLTSLRNRLTQLERIYELGHARLQRQARETATDSSEFMLTALLLLVLVSAPLIVTLSRRLRLAVRGEIRSRRELEEAKADLEAIALFDSLTGR